MTDTRLTPTTQDGIYLRSRHDTVYRFDALSDRAKDHARDWFREHAAQDFSDFGAESVIEDVARMADLLGIHLNTRSVKLMGGGTRQEPNIYWSVGDRDEGVSFAGSYYYRKGSVKAIASEAPAEHNGKVQEGNMRLNDIAQRLYDVQSRNFYRLQASIGHGRQWRMDIDVERGDSLAPSAEACEIVHECLKDFADWILYQLNAEWEYRNSDEAVDEDIRASEYEFTEEGKRA